MDQDLTILSPEKTILTYRLAGLGSRVGAHFLDLILVGAACYILAMAIGILGMIVDPYLAQGLILFLLFIIPFGYFIVLEGLWNGLTPWQEGVWHPGEDGGWHALNVSWRPRTQCNASSRYVARSVLCRLPGDLHQFKIAAPWRPDRKHGSLLREAGGPAVCYRAARSRFSSVGNPCGRTSRHDSGGILRLEAILRSVPRTFDKNAKPFAR